MYRKVLSIIISALMLVSCVIPTVSAQEITTGATVSANTMEDAKSRLMDLLNEAVSILTAPGHIYTPESYDRIEIAMAEGYAVYYNTSSSLEDINCAADKLDAAIKAKEIPGVSREALEYFQGIVDEAQKLGSSKDLYTKDSWASLESAVAEAEDVRLNGKTDEDYINCANRIKAAIDNLVFANADVIAARDYLRSMINYGYDTLNSDVKYTEDSLQMLKDILIASEELCNNPAATKGQLYYQADIIINTINYMDVIEISQEVIELLESVIAKADTEVGSQEDYTSSSWELFAQAYQNAQVVLSTGMSEDEYTEAAAALENAIVNLVLIDKELIAARENLWAVINNANALLNNGDTYTTETREALEDILADAAEIVLDENATKEIINAEVDKILAAVDSLEKLLVSETTIKYLSDLIDSAKNTVEPEDKYTAESWSVYKSALEEAQRVLTEGTTDEELLTAANNLGTAIEGLIHISVLISIARAELDEIIRSASNISGDYSKDSLSALQNAIASAKNIYNNPDATQEEINNAASLVKNAISNLRPDTSEDTTTDEAYETLKDAISKAEAEIENKDMYTAESLASVDRALDYAYEVLINGITDAEYLAATEMLNNALAKLEITKETITILLGDVDGDGKVTIKDATLIQKVVAGLSSIDDADYLSADANRDGNVNIKDATEIQKHLAGLNACEDIGKEINV